MKLASYRDGSRDGQLVVVSRDLALAHYATGIAGHLQQVLDDWGFLSPQLEELSQTLNHGRARHAFTFDPRLCMAPLPRAYLWVEPRRVPGQPEHAPPHLRQGRSDALMGPCDPIQLPGKGGAEPIFAGQVAVVCADLAQGSEPGSALESVRLLVLANSVHAVVDEAAAGSVALSPVAVTPDELGPAWQGGRVRLDLTRVHNGKRLGPCDLGAALPWHVGELLSRLALHRPLGAGSIVGCGTSAAVDASQDPDRGARSRPEHASGSATPCPALADGDSLLLDVTGHDGQSVFGAITQAVVQRGRAGS